MIATLIHAAPAAHWQPRNGPHLSALRLLLAVAPRLLLALDLERGTQALLRETTAIVGTTLDVIRRSYALPPAPVDAQAEEARYLLDVGDAVWRVQIALAALKACGLPRKREPRAATDERQRRHDTLRRAVRDLEVLL